MTTLLFYKPYEVVSAFTDDEPGAGRHTLKDYVDVPGVFEAGRLDRDSEGLLVLTDDGDLAHELTHPRFEHPKTYYVQVEGVATDEVLAPLREGIDMQGRRTKPAEVAIIPPPALPPRSQPVRDDRPTTWLQIVLREGKKRQVRHMTAAVGFPTLRLVRVAIGPLALGSLQPGQWRRLSDAELRALKRSLATPPAGHSASPRRGAQPHHTRSKRMDFATVAPPAAAHLNPERIAELQRRITAQLQDGDALGTQAVVARHGQVVLDVAQGTAHRDPPLPVTAETLFYSWSVAKPFTAMAVHLLIERGRLTLDTPIADVWPEFAQNGKSRATVGHALSHRAGVPLTPPSLQWHQYADWDAAVSAIAAAPLAFEPGSAVQYHSLTFGWILGEVVRRVDGRPIDRFVSEEFFAPLRMAHSYLRLPDAMLPQTAELAARANFADGVQAIQAWNLPLIRQAVIPAAGLHTTARDLARFYQMLLNGGKLDGVRVLQPGSIARARVRSSRPGELELDSQEPSHRAFGFSLGGHALSLWGGAASSPATFGHNGWATNASFADPERGLVCIILNNLMLADADNERRLRALTDVVLAACG